MHTQHITHFTEADLPQPDRERLLAILYGGAAANADSPADGPSAVDAGAGASGVDPATTHAESGASHARTAGGALQPSAGARPGSATNEAVA